MPSFIFEETYDRRPGSTDAEAGQQLARAWDCDVILDIGEEPEDVSAAEVIAALALLVGVLKGVGHPNHDDATCTKVEADPTDDPFIWSVRADYSEAPIQPGKPNAQKPDVRDPQVSVKCRREPYYGAVDLLGKAYRNSAGDYFDNLPPRFIAVASITVVRWYLTFDIDAALEDFINRINLFTWRGLPPDSVCMMDIDAQPFSENDWNGVQVTYSLEHKPVTPDQDVTATGGWRPSRVLDQGYNFIDGDGKKQAAPDDYGQPTRTPVLLDGLTGARLAAGQPPKYIDFVEHFRVDFSAI